MPEITFHPSGKSIVVPEGSALHHAAKAAGVSVETPCGGHGICGKCLVRIESGHVDFSNNGILSQELLDDGYVLICRTKVLHEPVSLLVLSQLDQEIGQFSEAKNDMLMVRRALLPKADSISPLVDDTSITVSLPSTGDGLSDLDRLYKALAAAFPAVNPNSPNNTIDPIKPLHPISPINPISPNSPNNTIAPINPIIPINVLVKLPILLRENEGRITVSHYRDGSDFHIVDIMPQFEGGIDDRNYGIAVDIGTTTVSVQLIDIRDAHVLASETEYNAQIECGLDVISRINYARKPERLEELKGKVLSTINGLIADLSRGNGILAENIHSASVAANTTMIHLLLGIMPEYIRLAPYTPAVYKVPVYTAEEIGIAIHPNAPVHIAPSVGSYVGGDITSGLLCTSLATDSEEVCLFIDIGTNGELVLGNHDFLIGCACSAGPAFEGGGIEHGMRASAGAIERVEIDRVTGIATYSTIGEGKPAGICGSGMVTLIAELFSTGWLDAAGKLSRTRICPSIDTSSKTARYIIAPADESSTGRPIYISEADIDNLIRAKAAIYSACRMMLKSVDMEFEDLARIYIAGGFGRYLDIGKATIIGLIPDLPAERFSYIGNASVTGAYMTLLSETHRIKQRELAEKLTYLDLSVEHGYMDQYTAAIFLPHTDAELFQNVVRPMN